MKPHIILYPILALGLLVGGCRSDSDARSTESSEANAAYAEAPSSQDDTRTVTGQLSGFDCAVVGQLCPSTHRGADYTTGVYTDEDAFYFVANIPQSFLTQYFLETVEVEGTVYPPYGHAIEPEVIHLIEEDDRRLVYEEGYFIDEEGNRATFQDGTFENGRWVVPE